MVGKLLGTLAGLGLGMGVVGTANAADIDDYLARRAIENISNVTIEAPEILLRGPLSIYAMENNKDDNAYIGPDPNENTKTEDPLMVKLPDLDNIREPQKEDTPLIKPITLSKGWDLDLMFEFLIVPKLMGCDALEERLDVTREGFEGSMGEEFGNQLQISPMFGSLGVVTRLTSPWGFTSRDHLTFLLSAHYASSSIFGKITSKKDYNATLLDGVIELGKTTALWEQNLNHHLALLAGIGYDWDLVRKPNFKLGAELSARAGLAYMEFSTLLDLFVHDTTQFEKFTYEVAAAIDVYRHRFTESEGDAWGGLGRFEGTFQFRFWKGLALDIGGGFQVEEYSNFHMNVTEYSGGFPDQEISEYLVRKNPINDRDDVGNIDNNINPMTRNGWYAFARLGWTFSGIFGTKKIETETGEKELYLPIQYLTPATTTDNSTTTETRLLR